MDDSVASRELLAKAFYLYKIAFEKTARDVGGHVTYASQHSALWGLLGNGRFSTAFWDGVCAGLAIEWLKARAAGNGNGAIRNVIAARNEALKPAGKQGSDQNVKNFIAKVQASHKAQNPTPRNNALTGAGLEYVNAATIRYPYGDISGQFPTRRYFYISSGSHAMAAYCSWTGSVTLYDPNVGEVSGTTRSFFGPYFKACKDASFDVQKAADDAHPDQRAAARFTIDVYKS